VSLATDMLRPPLSITLAIAEQVVIILQPFSWVAVLLAAPLAFDGFRTTFPIRMTLSAYIFGTPLPLTIFTTILPPTIGYI
jgi:hypothetical protein